MKNIISLILCTIILNSCVAPFQNKKKSEVKSNAKIEKKVTTPIQKVEENKIPINDKKCEEKNEKLKFELTKYKEWEKIDSEAKSSFKTIKNIFDNKCITCHNSTFQLPIYGKIFEDINPVQQHFKDGIKFFDYLNEYPFKASGNPPQIALLKALKNVVEQESMPIQSFLLVYPDKKLKEDEKEKILDWANKVIIDLEEFELKYAKNEIEPSKIVTKIFENKCILCHGNGKALGKFGDIENLSLLKKSKYLNLVNPSESLLFKVINTNRMPPGKSNSLSDEEKRSVLDWIEEVSKNH